MSSSLIIQLTVCNHGAQRCLKTMQWTVLSTVEAYSTKYKRTNIVSDAYQPSSLKVETMTWYQTQGTSKGKNSLKQAELSKRIKWSCSTTWLTKVHRYRHQTVILTNEEDAVSNHSISLHEVAVVGMKKLTHGPLFMPDMQHNKVAKSSW